MGEAQRESKDVGRLTTPYSPIILNPVSMVEQGVVRKEDGKQVGDKPETGEEKWWNRRSLPTGQQVGELGNKGGKWLTNR